jgi:hypothetical protein
LQAAYHQSKSLIMGAPGFLRIPAQQLVIWALPLAGPGRFQDSIGNAIGGKGITESWSGGLSAADGIEEVGNLVDESVFIADLQARHPPLVHVGMVAIGDVK